MMISYLPPFHDCEHACPRCQGVQNDDDILEITITETREIQWGCCFCGAFSPVHEWEVCV